MTRIALLCLVAACSGSGSNTPPPTPTPTPNTPAPTGGETAPPPPLDVAQLGSACGSGDTCAAPMECVKYFGVAGAKGGQLSSCEVRCEKETCPEHSHCATIADGPGRVCRADAK